MKSLMWEGKVENHTDRINKTEELYKFLKLDSTWWRDNQFVRCLLKKTREFQVDTQYYCDIYKAIFPVQLKEDMKYIEELCINLNLKRPIWVKKLLSSLCSTYSDTSCCA